ncbi:hypothetical protein [Maribacter halichondriae]|uniref:hypothetical protein n=1 Tax=Maribacter halichondriae TaxID=2980554 RepID=UPI0023589E36|nr:hypothetical protein [Maribacter sp. Hal144]
METNKFEKHIQERLKGREIQPSLDAWERISEQLEMPETSKSKSYFWYGIAASVVGLILISVLVFKGPDIKSTPEVEIVNSPKTDVKSELEEETTPVEKTIETTIVLEDVQKKSSEVIQGDVVVGDVGPEKTSNDFEVKIEDNDTRSKLSVSDARIEAKIAEMVAQVDAMEQDTSALTDAEVDSLLRMAQQELLTDKLFSNSGSVDAMALLSEVEEELDQSFRNQIFEKLKSGFLKVRTAVVDRNN